MIPYPKITVWLLAYAILSGLWIAYRIVEAL